MHDVLIIGSGVIGMSIARQLSQSHLDIALIDRDVPGKHASYKAGGMLGAQNEFTEDTDLGLLLNHEVSFHNYVKI